MYLVAAVSFLLASWAHLTEVGIPSILLLIYQPYQDVGFATQHTVLLATRQNGSKVLSWMHIGVFVAIAFFCIFVDVRNRSHVVKIGLNLLPALRENGGTWNYIASLIQALAEWDKQNTYVAFVNSASVALVPTQENFKIQFVNIDAYSRPQRIAYEHTLLILSASKQKLDCMHWLGNTVAITNRLPSLVTVYDLLAFSPLTPVSPLKRIYLKFMIQYSAQNATILLPMSNATRQALSSHLGVSVRRMEVIRFPLSPEFKPAGRDATAALCRRYKLPEMFWLYVAHTYPHKNHLMLLQAYAELRRSGRDIWPLVLRGDPRQGEQEIEMAISHLGLQNSVIRLPRLDKGEMPILYSAASAMIFPSLYEGGGLPVVEAMACGCTVAASNLDSLIDYCDDAALYFQPQDSRQVRETMEKIQSQPDLRRNLSARGIQQAMKFGQKEIALKLIDVYGRAANNLVQKP